MKYFLPIIAMLIILSCKQSETNKAEAVKPSLTEPFIARLPYPKQQVGLITNVRVSLVAKFADGRTMVITHSLDPALVSEETIPVIKTDSLEIFPMANIQMDLDADSIADTTVSFRYVGQKKGDHIDPVCGNFISKTK